jgi:catechol 2,3-dioxygenase-like lactoylglutathione lyase family enzyme
MERPFKIKGMDHVALTVRDIQASVNFYHHTLGLELLNAEEYAAGTRSFLSVRLGEMLIDLFPAKKDLPEQKGTLNHFCVYLDTDLNFDEFVNYVKQAGFQIINENRHNWGAFGYGDSVYVRDPDGNSVELKKY